MLLALGPPRGGGDSDGSVRCFGYERQTVAMELAAALHHSRDVGPGKDDGLRAQKTASSGKRPGVPTEPEAQVGGSHGRLRGCPGASPLPHRCWRTRRPMVSTLVPSPSSRGLPLRPRRRRRGGCSWRRRRWRGGSSVCAGRRWLMSSPSSGVPSCPVSARPPSSGGSRSCALRSRPALPPCPR